MPHVTVSVNGRNYRMACDPGQEDHLVSLAARMDGAIDEFREAFGEIGDQRLTVMASILMTDRLDEAEKKVAALTQEIERLRSAHEDAVSRVAGLEAQVAEAIRAAATRVESMAAELGREVRDAKMATI